MVVVHLGWVDSDLRSSPGQWDVTAAICCPAGGWNILNLSQSNPGAVSTMVTLYSLSILQKSAQKKEFIGHGVTLIIANCVLRPGKMCLVQCKREGGEDGYGRNSNSTKGVNNVTNMLHNHFDDDNIFAE